MATSPDSSQAMISIFKPPRLQPFLSTRLFGNASTSILLAKNKRLWLSSKRPVRPVVKTINSLPTTTLSAFPLESLRNNFSRGFNGLSSNSMLSRLANSFKGSGGGENGQNVVYGILGINAVVFLAWQWADQNHRHVGDSKLLGFMIKHFTLGFHSSSLSWILANFSHKDFFHLLINSYVLYSFGTTLISVLGVQRFMVLYAISALTTSAASMFFKYQELQRTRRPPPPSLGASGCTSGLLITFAALYPWATVQVIFFPMPAIVAVGGFAAWDLYSTFSRRGSLVDSAGHIGGGLGGLLYYLVALKR